ncbi:MAG: hypothetical protein ACTSXT_00095 [Candidatus Helarchaeota archaeon]
MKFNKQKDAANIFKKIATLLIFISLYFIKINQKGIIKIEPSGTGTINDKIEDTKLNIIIYIF